MRTAIVSVALLALFAGCSGKSSKSGSGLPALLNGNTGATANFSCNHTFTDPPSTATQIAQSVLVVSQGLSASPPSPGSSVVVFSTATGSTSGTAVITSTSGAATVTVSDHTRLSFKIRESDSNATVDTYNLNQFTGSVATAGSALGMTIFELTTYNTLATFAGVSIAGKAQIAAEVQDCDGAPVENATVTVGGTAVNTCGATATLPCVMYFSGGIPSGGAHFTAADGQFLVFGLTPGATVTLAASGALVADGASTQIGELEDYGVADSIAIGSTTPLRN